MKKRAILIVGLALLMATAGVVYAHWTDTLQVNATVYTGNVNMNWNRLDTDDDGGNAFGEEPGVINYGTQVEPDGEYDFNVGFSSTDPSSPGYPTFATRYTKDVANCGGLIPMGDDGEWGPHPSFVLEISNAYPSYHCTIWSKFQNMGSVPVKVQSIVTNTYVAGSTTPTDISAFADWATLDGTLCGLQIDPLEEDTTINTVHILQGAGQGATYTMEQTINFVNWNEWDPMDCTHTFNTDPAPLPCDLSSPAVGCTYLLP